MTLNSTFFSAGSGNRSVNHTISTDGKYTYNVTVTDLANNTNQSQQRTITVDTTRPLMTISVPGTGNNTNISSGNVTLTMSYTETNFANVTVHLRNASNSLNAINKTFLIGGGNTTINFSHIALSDGNYTFNVTVVDLANNWNTSGDFAFTVDSTFPQLNHTTATVTNNSNLSVLTFIMNVSLTESNLANLTFIVANASNGSQIFNTTTFTDRTRLFLNYTLNGDGNYTVNVTATDTANNRNMTRNVFFTVDVNAPAITSSVSPSSILPSEAVTLACSVSDRIDPSVTATLSVKKPSASSFSTVSAGSYTDTTGEGTYTFRCTSTDYTGNTVSIDKTFSVGAGGSSGGSSGGGGGGSNTRSSAPAVEEQKEVVVEEEAEEATVSIESSDAWDVQGEVQYSTAAVGEVYTFSFVPEASGVVEEHSLTISSIDEVAGTVTITVASAPQEITLAIGESKEVDLDSDGVMDMLVTLNGISNGLADVSFAKLGDWIEAEEVLASTYETEAKNYTWLWILVGVVALAILILLLSMMRKSGSAPKKTVLSGKKR